MDKTYDQMDPVERLAALVELGADPIGSIAELNAIIDGAMKGTFHDYAMRDGSICLVERRNPGLALAAIRYKHELAERVRADAASE